MDSRCILCDRGKSTTLFVIKEFKIVKCIKCNLVYVNPWPSKKQLEKIYKNYNFKDGFLHEEHIRNDSRRSLRNIRKLGYKNGNLLDLGCGAGFFLDEARKFGWKTFGIDTAENLIKYATRNLKLNVLQKDILEYNPKTTFDVVMLIQVIEHLTDPYPLLEKIKKLLNDDGIFCISTPNIDSFLFKVFQENYKFLIPPEHVIYYSPDTLLQLLEKSGFRVIKTITYSFPMDLGGIYRALRTKQLKNSYVETRLDSKSQIVNSDSQPYIKQLKHLFFEEVICKYGYPILNIANKGSIVEFYVKKYSPDK